MKKYKIPLEEIDSLAKSENFFRIDYQENIGMVSYSNGACRINVYLTKMTVSTSLNHPKKGSTQLFRKNVDFKMLKDIFEYPRKHTCKGYFNKPKIKT